MSKIQIKNVRLSFPNLLKKEIYAGKEGKYGATFLIPKSDKATMVLINDAIKELKALHPTVDIAKDKYAIKDGDNMKYDGCKDSWVLKATNNIKPLLISASKQPITEEGMFYSGCYVNAVIDFWIQNNQYGRRVNANLHGVQFWNEGEFLGTKAIADVNDFTDSKDDDVGNMITDAEDDDIFN